jgi:hypothetical protein
MALTKVGVGASDRDEVQRGYTIRGVVFTPVVLLF